VFIPGKMCSPSDIKVRLYVFYTCSVIWNYCIDDSDDKPSSLPRYRRRNGNIRGPAPRGLDISRKPDQQPQSLLLNKLPPELRLAIWEIVLGNLRLHIIQRSHRRLGCVVCPQQDSCDICRGALLQPVKNPETCSNMNLLSLLVTCKQM
jgi:hypothetical protein